MSGKIKTKSSSDINQSTPPKFQYGIDQVRHETGNTGTTPGVYFDYLYPDAPTDKPYLILVHGGAHTGTCYLQTPDGRPGWAEYFARLGYRVIVPDWPGSGRSAAVPLNELTGEVVCNGLNKLLDYLGEPVVLLTHSMSGTYGWRLLENNGAQIMAVVAVAPGPPGNIQEEPQILKRNELYVEIESFDIKWRLPLRDAMIPNEKIINDKFLGSSKRFPREALDKYRASLQQIGPHLIYERMNVDGSQFKINDTEMYRNKPMLIVTGTEDIDHSREIDAKLAEWLQAQGASVDFWFLSDLGINGNGHMLMLEENSDEIAALISGWLEQKLN